MPSFDGIAWVPLLLVFLVAGNLAGHAQPIGSEPAASTLQTVLDSVVARNATLSAYKQIPFALDERSRDVGLPDPRVSFTYFPEPIYTARGSQQWSLRG